MLYYILCYIYIERFYFRIKDALNIYFFNNKLCINY